MAANTPTSSASGGQPQMDIRLLDAATNGHFWSMKDMAKQNPSILLGTTPQGNNCLHIASIHGHEGFCKDVLELKVSLLSDANLYAETPLIVAVTRGNDDLVSLLLQHCKQLGLRQAILQQDRKGFNALHHAIRNGQNGIAVELIEAEPELSKALTNHNESPMFMAVMRDFIEVSTRLLEIPDSAYGGNHGRHALHAAAKNGNTDISRKIMEKRPELATKADSDGITPIRMAVLYNKVYVLRLLLEYDSSLGYEIDETGTGYPLLCSAADRDQVDVARRLLERCPDAPYCTQNADSFTCLHIAIRTGHLGFIQFILRAPGLEKLVNMQDSQGKTALHYAVKKGDPRLVQVLLCHKDIDTTVLDNNGSSAAAQLSGIPDNEKTLDMMEVHMLLWKADPRDVDSLYYLLKGSKQQDTIGTRIERKALTKTYTNNTSLVAILLATITFTAAFTLPGGYSSDAGSAGLPIMSRKIAFQAFLVSDTLAMCSSFVVAFICLMGKWEDDQFTRYYMSATKNLTWFAYITTITAFSTGLYTVLATRLHWLAILICFIVALLPIITKMIGEWPVYKFRYRLGNTFNSDLFGMV